MRKVYDAVMMINEDILIKIIEINRAADDILASAVLTRGENERSVADEIARLSREDSRKTERKLSGARAKLDEKLKAELEKIEEDKAAAMAKLENEYDADVESKAEEIAQKVCAF